MTTRKKAAAKPKAKAAPGRPQYVPTKETSELIKTLSAMGIPDYDIAKVVKLSEPTMRKYYHDELAVGHIEANAKVAQSLFKMATRTDKPVPAAAIFWMKCRAGWVESTETLPGIKAQANQAAATAGAGSEWGDDLVMPISLPN